MRLLRRVGVLAGLGWLAAVGLLVLAPQALAHAVVVGSDPADGSRLGKAPASVTVRFDEPVGLGLGYLRVVDTAGRRVDTGVPSHPNGDGTAVIVSLKSGLGDGSYLASFRVVSADSHPVAGSIRFVVGNGALGVAGQPSQTASVNPLVATALAVTHWTSFAGVALVGGSWLIFSVWPAGQRRRAIRTAIWTGWSMAAGAAIVELLLQGPYDAGSSLGTALQSTLVDATLHVNSGQLLSLRLVLLGVLGIVLSALLGEQVRRRPSWGPEAAAIVGAGIVVTFAASGHSQSANPRWLAVLVDALHLGAMAVWLGGLAIMVVAAYNRRRAADVDTAAEDATELAAGLPIFSRVALAAIAVLTVTGTIQAWREIGTVDAITTTWYGRLVIGKVAGLAAIIGLGYLARRIVLRRDWAITGGPLRRMRATLLTEVCVGALVLAMSGVLISLAPGKVALAAERSRPRTATVAVTSGARATVSITPGVHGPVTVEIALAGSITPTSVTASASLPSKSLGPIALALQSAGPKTYTASGVILPSVGSWQITVTVQSSAFDSTTAVATVRLD